MDPLLIDIPDEIVGERVLVRPYRAGDGPAVFEAIDESREHIVPWLPWGPSHKTVDDSEIFVRRGHLKWHSREDLGCGIFEKSSGRYLGGTGLHRIDWNVGSFEIGYWIRKSAHGMGYVTESTLLLTQFAFEILHANRICITVAEPNDRSSAIPKRLGYKFEGTLRNSIRDSEGNLHGRLMFGMTPEDWNARKGSR